MPQGPPWQQDMGVMGWGLFPAEETMLGIRATNYGLWLVTLTQG